MFRVSRLIIFDDGLEALFDIDYNSDYSLQTLANTKSKLKAGDFYSFCVVSGSCDGKLSGCAYKTSTAVLCALYARSKRDNSNKTDLYMVSLLKRLSEILKNLLGSLNAEVVLSNLCLVQEVVDLYMCDGYVQLSAVDKIRSHVVTKLLAPRKSSSANLQSAWIPDHVASSEAAHKSSLPSQQKQDSYVEELYVDVVERIEATFSSQEQVSCSIKGYISLNNFLKNATSAIVTLSDSVYETLADSEEKRLKFPEYHFHQSIDPSTFLDTLQFSVPLTAGEVKAMTYCVPKVDVVPFFIKPRLFFQSSNVVIEVRLCCQLPPGVMGLGLSTVIPVPPNKKTYTKVLKGPNQTASLDLTNNVIRWGVSQICGGAQLTAKFMVPLPETLSREEAQLAISRITVDFELSNYLCSGLRVSSVKLSQPPPVGYRRWLRYLSSAAHYTVMVGRDCWVDPPSAPRSPNGIGAELSPDGASVQDPPPEGAPVETSPPEGLPVQDSPLEGAPVQDPPLEGPPVGTPPPEETPN